MTKSGSFLYERSSKGTFLLIFACVALGLVGFIVFGVPWLAQRYGDFVTLGLLSGF